MATARRRQSSPVWAQRLTTAAPRPQDQRRPSSLRRTAPPASSLCQPRAELGQAAISSSRGSGKVSPEHVPITISRGKTVQTQSGRSRWARANSHLHRITSAAPRPTARGAVGALLDGRSSVHCCRAAAGGLLPPQAPPLVALNISVMQPPPLSRSISMHHRSPRRNSSVHSLHVLQRGARYGSSISRSAIFPPMAARDCTRRRRRRAVMPA